MARREYQKPNVLRQDGPQPYWYIRYKVRVFHEGRFERKEKWHRLGDCDKMTKREAERARDTLLATVNNQVLTLREHIPFKDFVEIYRNDFMPTLGPAAQAKYNSHINNHLLPAFGPLSLSAIDTQRIQSLLTSKHHLSWWARSDMRNILSGIFTRAIKWGYWTRPNPAMDVELGQMEPKRDNRALSDQEVNRIIAAIDDPQLRLIVETLVLTGMRTSELFGLKWQYVDLHRGVIMVRERNYRGHQGQPKSRRSKRDLPITSLVERYRAIQGQGFVFQQDGEPLDERSVLKYRLRPIVKRLGFYFEGFGWHTFRRTHLTVLSEEGATAFETRDQAGHSKIETTMGYVKPSMERRTSAVKRLEDRLFSGIVRGRNDDEAA